MVKRSMSNKIYDKTTYAHQCSWCGLTSFCQLFLTENLDLPRFVIYKMQILPKPPKTDHLYLGKLRIYGLDKLPIRCGMLEKPQISEEIDFQIFGLTSFCQITAVLEPMTNKTT